MHEGHRSRLRESFIRHGAASFYDHQLLELLLFHSIPRTDTNPVAHKLLEHFGSLADIFDAPIDELMQVEGVGEKSALLISLVGACMQRKERSTKKKARLHTPAAAMRYCKTLFWAERNECMYVILLDKKQEVLRHDKVSSGTLNETAVYPRTVVECALRGRASSVLLAHNHPSGDVNPSSDDIETTMLILRALEPIGIRLHDHIIVGRDMAYSMARNGIIEQTEPEFAAVAEKEGGAPDAPDA